MSLPNCYSFGKKNSSLIEKIKSLLKKKTILEGCSRVFLILNNAVWHNFKKSKFKEDNSCSHANADWTLF